MCEKCQERAFLLNMVKEKTKIIRRQQKLIAAWQQLKLDFNPN